MLLMIVGGKRYGLMSRDDRCRLFTILSKAYAFHFAGEHMRSLYEDLSQSVSKKDLSKLPEVPPILFLLPRVKKT